MTITQAVYAYRKTEDDQEEIEDQLFKIDDAESDLNERKVQIQRELRQLPTSKLDVFRDQGIIRRVASLQTRIKEIDEQLAKIDSKAQLLGEQNKSLVKIQSDLEKVFGKKALYAEYDRVFHGIK